MVSDYGDPAAEALAVRASAGIIDWTGGTRLCVTHSGTRTAHDFLQGLLSNDVPVPPAQAGCYATLLTNTGKIISDCRVWPRAEGFLVTTESPAGPALRDALAKYGFLDDVAVTEVSDALGLLGLHGPGAVTCFEDGLGAVLPGLEPDVLLPVSTSAGEVQVTRTTATGEVGFDLLVAREHLEAVWTALAGAGATPFGLDAFHRLRVEAGVPWVGAELDDRVLPNQANLEHAVSFTKGCYVGQEAVAKLHYLGRSSRRLVGLLLGDVPPPARDTELRADGRPVGRITSAVPSPTRGETIAIAMCRTAFAEPGMTVTLGEAGSATVTALPFVRPADPADHYAEPDTRDRTDPPF